MSRTIFRKLTRRAAREMLDPAAEIRAIWRGETRRRGRNYKAGVTVIR